MTNEEIVSRIQGGVEDKAPLYGQLYAQNQTLLRIIAQRYACGDPLDDYMQESYLALVRAADTYDQSRGVKFMSYAGDIIGRHLFRYRAQQGGVLRRSEARERMLLAYSRLCAEYQSQFKRPPMDGEIAAYLDISQEAAQRIREEATYSVISLYAPVGDDTDATLLDTIPDPDNVIEDAQEDLQDAELAAILWAEVDKLEERQRRIIRAKYKEGRTLADVSKEMGVTPAAVSKRAQAALDNLRESLKLQDYLEIRSLYKGTGLETYKHTQTSAPEYIALRTHMRARFNHNTP